MMVTSIKRFVLCTALGFMSLTIFAQNPYISSTRDEFSDQMEDLGNRYGLVLLSTHNDLVVNVTNLPDGQRPTIRRMGKKEHGFYETQVIVDIIEPKVQVSRRGSVYHATILEPLTHKGFVAYRIDEVPNPVRLEDQTQNNSVRLSATEAELEFTTSVKNLQVHCAPELGAKITRSQKSGDTSLEMINVVFPIAPLATAREEQRQAEEAVKEQEKYIDTHLETANDQDDEKLEQLRIAAQKANEYLDRLGSVEIYADGSNRMPVDIRQMGARSKKLYAVLPLNVGKTVIKGDYSNYMDQAGRFFEERKYKDARTAYVNALKANDVLDNMRPIIRQSVAECDSCLKYTNMAFNAIKRLSELRQGGAPDQQSVAEYASVAIDCFKQVQTYNDADFYSEKVVQLEQFIQGMPLEVRFSIYEWVNLSQGDGIGNVEIWAYYGDGTLSSASVSRDRDLQKMMKRQGRDFAQLGMTNPDGKSEVELNRKRTPRYLLFRPQKDSGVKNYVISYDKLMSDSEGTYMKKTFSLRMFRKQ